MTEDLSGTTPAASASEDRRSPNAKRIRSDGCSVAVLTPRRSGAGRRFCVKVSTWRVVLHQEYADRAGGRSLTILKGPW
jgi:hypothetical protein